jgi:hypothetical protein
VGIAANGENLTVRGFLPSKYLAAWFPHRMQKLSRLHYEPGNWQLAKGIFLDESI